MLKTSMEMENPPHPIYQFMIYSTVISVQQIVDAIRCGEENPEMDNIESLFHEMINSWFNGVLEWRQDENQSKQLFLRRDGRHNSAGGGGNDEDEGIEMEREIDLDAQDDPFLHQLEDRLNLLRLALGKLEIEARHRIQECCVYAAREGNSLE